MIRVFGSALCPDCVACKAALDAAGAEYEFIDICGGMPALKEFLRHRDAEEAFDAARAAGQVGIPAVLLEDGTLTPDWKGRLAELGLPVPGEAPAEAAALGKGSACRLDGTGC